MPKYVFDLDELEFEEHLRYEARLSKKIKLFVFNRDDWQCRRCNSSNDLHPHHYVYRSRQRDHHPDNLITLCAKCHRAVHDGKVWIFINASGDAFFGGSRADLFPDRLLYYKY